MDQHRINPAALERALAMPGNRSSDYDLNQGWRPKASAPLRAASVLVPFVPRAGGLAVILTRRAALLKHHPGQVAFPGGKQDPGDPTPLAAALREAEEEIGLTGVSVIGGLDPHETVTGFTVSPFLGLVPPGFAPVIDRAEVEEVFEVPASFLLDPGNFQVQGRTWQGHLRRYYTIPYGPHYIWGATARILRSLADRMQAT